MKRNTVSLCVMARDEEATIGLTIKSVLALVDEVIVADTGSADNTRIISEGYGARVLDVPWEDDFAAVRNAMLKEATCDWILILDADEYLQPMRPVEFQRLLYDPGAAGFEVAVTHNRGPGDVATTREVRLFRNHPDVRYRYPIHEQITPELLAWADRQSQVIQGCELAIVNEGHKPERVLRNRERNHRLLQKALTVWPQEPYFPYRLACDSLLAVDGEIQPIAGVNASLGHLHTAWRQVNRLPEEYLCTLDWLPDLGAKITSALLAVGRVEDARSVVAQVKAILPNNPQVVLQDVAAVVALLQDGAGTLSDQTIADLAAAARQDLGRLQIWLEHNPTSAVDTGLKALYPLRYQGELALLEGHVSEAVGLFEQVLTIDPGYSFGWLGMAECSRFAGDSKRALKLYLRTVTESQWNHRAWLRGSQLMQEMGFVDNAASWWRKILTQFPEHPVLAATEATDATRVPPLQVTR